MIAFAALAVALLLSHQPPQIETDRRAGKLSFAVRFGVCTDRFTARLLFAVFLAGCACRQPDDRPARRRFRDGPAGTVLLASRRQRRRKPETDTDRGDVLSSGRSCGTGCWLASVYPVVRRGTMRRAMIRVEFAARVH